MPSLREIRRKIKSVKSTQQITKAMKMVAAARMRRAQSAILSSRPFAVRLEEAIRQLALLEVAADRQAGREIHVHPLFANPSPAGEGGGRSPLAGEGAAPKARALVMITADKGLCGAFNASILRAAAAWLRRNEGRPVLVAAVGRKARDFFRRVASPERRLLLELVNIFPKVGFKHAELLGQPLLERFAAGELESVTVAFNEFKSAVAQRVVERPLLPIPIPSEPPEGTAVNPFGFSFEPERRRLLDALLPRFVKAELYRFLLESQAAELAARMNAMDAATKNAGELIDGLTLRMNRTRQTIITNEIAELVGGAEALKS